MTQESVQKVIEDALTSTSSVRVKNMGLTKYFSPAKYEITITANEIQFESHEAGRHLTFKFDDDFSIELVDDIEVIN